MRPPRGSQTASPDRCPWVFAPTPTVFRPPIHTPPAVAPPQPDLPSRPAPLPDGLPPPPLPAIRPVPPPLQCRRTPARADQPSERPSRPFPRPPPSRHPFPSFRHLPSRARQLPPIRPAAPLRPRFPPLTATPPRPLVPPLPVRFPGGLRVLSTDSATFFPPHGGDSGVVQILSTGEGVWTRSWLVRWLGISGKLLSTGCGELFVHRPPGRLVHRVRSAAHRERVVVHSFSTGLSTVRQRNTRSHQGE